MSDEEVTEEDWKRFKSRAQELMLERGEWAGTPIPIHGTPLVLEPKYPYQGLNNQFFGDPCHEPLEGTLPTIHNSWYSHKLNADVVVYSEEDGKRHAHVIPMFSVRERLTMQLETLGCVEAWELECEARAQEKLMFLIGGHHFKQYQLTGMFMETSKRSGVTYLFRRLRPTVAFHNLRFLAALCLHPIGFYAHTWGGVMVPTDCVIAHLLLMRGCEHRYWKLSNQHPPHEPGAGI